MKDPQDSHQDSQIHMAVIKLFFDQGGDFVGKLGSWVYLPLE